MPRRSAQHRGTRDHRSLWAKAPQNSKQGICLRKHNKMCLRLTRSPPGGYRRFSEQVIVPPGFSEQVMVPPKPSWNDRALIWEKSSSYARTSPIPQPFTRRFGGRGRARGWPAPGTGEDTSCRHISQHGHQGRQLIAWAPQYPEAARGSPKEPFSCTAPCSLPQTHSPAPEGKTRRGFGGTPARPSAWLEKAFVRAVLQGRKSALLGLGFAQVQEPWALSGRKQRCRSVTKPASLSGINLKADFKIFIRKKWYLTYRHVKCYWFRLPSLGQSQTNAPNVKVTLTSAEVLV